MAEAENQPEDRQLEATERRIQKAREEGQFPQSRDLTTLVVLIVFSAIVLLAGAGLGNALLVMVKAGLSLSHGHHDWENHLLAWLAGPVMSFVTWLAAIMAPVWIVSMAAPLALVKFQPVWTFKFKISALNPITGFGRVFSIETANEALKSLLKVALVFGISSAYLWDQFYALHMLTHQDLPQGLAEGWAFLIRGLGLLLLPLLVVALMDVALRWFSFRKRIRMSPEELKQELKETEGSPEQRNRQRQRQRQIATTRMISALEKADVVLVNPEHYAVALQYDPEKMPTPVVVAKGLDELALRMQAVARDKDIPVARIPPLARMMHQRLNIGQAIPPGLFEAVAKVIAWAYDSKGKAEWEKPPLPEIAPFSDEAI